MGDRVYHFQTEVIERVVAPGQPGNYVLGEKAEAGELYPKLIGRSDTDVKQEQRRKVGTANYGFFKVANSGPNNAYDLECAQYHRFRTQLDDMTHPASTPGSGRTCFLCGL
jgi:hypothetical protein